MKRILLLFFTCCLCLPLLAEESNVVLRVELNDGTYNDYVIEDRPQISFSGNQVVFECKGISTSYNRDDVRNFAFIAKDDTRIHELRNGDTRITFTGNSHKLTVEGITEKDLIKVFSINGQQYPVKVNYAGSQADILLTSLSDGYYIINIGNKLSIKILRK